MRRVVKRCEGVRKGAKRLEAKRLEAGGSSCGEAIAVRAMS